MMTPMKLFAFSLISLVFFACQKEETSKPHNTEIFKTIAGTSGDFNKKVELQYAHPNAQFFYYRSQTSPRDGDGEWVLTTQDAPFIQSDDVISVNRSKANNTETDFKLHLTHTLNLLSPKQCFERLRTNPVVSIKISSNVRLVAEALSGQASIQPWTNVKLNEPVQAVFTTKHQEINTPTIFEMSGRLDPVICESRGLQVSVRFHGGAIAIQNLAYELN